MLKKLSKVVSAFLVSVMMASPVNIYGEESGKDETMRILFTGNLRNHLDAVRVSKDEDKEIVLQGGYAKLSTTLQQYANENTLQIDMGDFSLGSAYDCLFDTGMSMDLLNDLGYDYVGVGDRDLANGVKGLESMVSSSDSPVVLSSNVKDGNFSKGEVTSVNGKKVGVFSVIGDSASQCLSDSLTEDVRKAAKESVHSLKKEGAHEIICVFHGTMEEGKELAREVKGISLMLCGEEVDTVEKVEKEGSTLLVGSGCYGEYVSVLDLKKDFTVKNYEVVPTTEQEDSHIAEKVKSYATKAEESLGLKLDTSIGYIQKDMQDPFTADLSQANTLTQDLVLDSYAKSYEEYRDRDEDNSFTIAVSNRYSFLGGIPQGKITYLDILNSADRGSNDTLYTAYIQGKDVRKLCELDYLYGKSNPVFQMAFSGVKYTYLDKRIRYNEVVDVYVEEARGYWSRIDEETYYPVVFTDSFFQVVRDSANVAEGILKVGLYTSSSGNTEVTDEESCIMKDESGAEMKCLDSIQQFIEGSKRNNEKLHDITDMYSSKDSFRSTTSFSLSNLLVYPSDYALAKYIRWGKIAGCIVAGLIVFTMIWNRCHPYRKG